jgi:hypothetical protein
MTDDFGSNMAYGNQVKVRQGRYYPDADQGKICERTINVETFEESHPLCIYVNRCAMMATF